MAERHDRTYRSLGRLLGCGVVLSALALAASRPAAASNASRLTAYGPRAAGRGGVDYAFADDATGGATNPAGIAFIGNRVDQGWGLFSSSATFTNAFAEKNNSPRLVIPVPAYTFGVVFDPSAPWKTSEVFDFGNWGLRTEKKAPVPSPSSPKDPPRYTLLDALKPDVKKKPAPVDDEPTEEELFGGNIRIGLGIYPVTGGFFRYRAIQTPKFPAGLEYKGAAEMLALTPLFAVRLNRYFSIGLAPQFIYSKFKIKGPISQPKTVLAPDFQLATTILTIDDQIITVSNSKNLATFGFSGRVGLMFHSDFFSAGLVFQERTYLQDHLGSVRIDATSTVDRLTQGSPGQLQLVNPQINPALGFRSEADLRVKLNFPRQLGVGLAFHPFSRLSIGVDYTYIRWAELYKNFEARLTRQSNPNLPIMTSESLKVIVPLDYTDQHVIALGISALVARGDDIVPGGDAEWGLVVRAGWNWGKNPQPKDTIMPQFPTFFAHHASFGLSYLWGPYWDFTVAMEYAFDQKVSPDFHRGNPDLSNSEMTTQLTSIYAGFGCKF